MVYSRVGMYDFRPTSRSVKLPHGHSDIEGYGKLDVRFRLVSGEMLRIQLQDVVYIPNFRKNLFSLNAVADRGYLSEVSDTGTFLRHAGLAFPRTKERLCTAIG